MKIMLRKWILLTSKRRLYMLLKLFIIVIMFGLYIFFLMQESMSVIEKHKLNGKIKDSPQQHGRYVRIGRTAGTQNATQYQQHKPKLGKNLSVKSSSKAVVESSSLSTAANLVNATSQISTPNPIYEYSEEMSAMAEHDFAERRQLLVDGCAKWKLADKYPPNAWEFFISPGHGLAWCNIFKAASSAWLYYFNILGGYQTAYLQRTKASPLELARKRFPRPSPNELNEALPNSVSFLVVREPFERLLSAYRNKLEGYRNKYYKLLGEQIVKKFRTPSNKKKQKISKMPKGPTFKEFLQFLTHHYKTGGRFDEHWSPIYSFCTPCAINFTLVAKTETFQRDTEYIIRQAGLDTLLLDKMPKKKGNLKKISNRSTSSTKGLIPKYFSQIDVNLLKQVLEIYGPDFDLFGYNATKYFDLVQPKSTTTPLHHRFSLSNSNGTKT